VLFTMAPYIVVVSSLAAFIFLPFSDTWIAVSMDVGLFAMLAVMSLEVIGVILAGYSSGSKWALFGAMREAAQMVSYEIPMALCAVIPVIAAGSLNLNEIAALQSGHALNWFVFHDPFTFAAFFVYFTCATASCKRAPFDLAEAESELVAGFLTEYSGMRWSFFFLAEYASMFAVSGIAVMLFLGGWHLGIPGLYSTLDGAIGTDVVSSWGFNWALNACGALVFLVKSSLLVIVQIWIRWTLPRLRIDQVMMTCLKYLIPISCVLFLGAIVWPLLLSATLQRTTVFPAPFSQPIGHRAGNAYRDVNQANRQPAESDTDSPRLDQGRRGSHE